MSIRGLPDERPRPSVANLIGRFEQRASKRQSSVGPGSGGPAGASPTASPSQSRSTSVVSHNTGDSAAIEAKERREWPPQQFKNNNSNGSSNFGNVTNGSGSGNANGPASTTFSVADLRRSLEKSVVGDSMRNTVISPPPDTSDDVQPAPPLSASVALESEAKQVETAPPPPSANSELSSASEEVKSDTEKKETSTGSAPIRAAGKITASKSSKPGSIGKTAVTPRPSAITHSKSTSSAPTATKTSSATPPTAKPLTAQRTGNSTISGAATRAAGAKSPPVSTTLRAKTPTARGPRASTSGSHLKPGTSGITDRAKTPTAATSPARAKTPTASASLSGAKHAPSSGLYAPTKASLARAKNAEAQLPPVPKPTVSASTLERLMKPTAASASKVRGPVPVPTSPPRAPAAKSGKGTPTSPPSSVKGKALKPRVGLAPARMREERERKEKSAAVKGAAVPGAVVAAAAVVQLTSEDEHEYEPEQPSIIAATGLSDTSHTQEEDHEHGHGHEEEHEQEPDHTGPPSDIESYDDAFASDDDRALELDPAHLVSARPSVEGEREDEREAFAVTSEVQVEVNVEEHEPVTDVVQPTEPVEEEVKEVVPHSESEPESESVKEEEVSAPAEPTEPVQEAVQDPVQTEDAPHSGHEVELESKVEAGAIGPATPTIPTSKQNGFSAPEPATTEFDSVLNMLAVKPPVRPASLGDIPDEEL